jgi:hypothetical protein
MKRAVCVATLFLSLPLALAACTQAPPVSFPAYSAVSPFAHYNALTVLHGTVQKFSRDSIGRPDSLFIQTGEQVKQVHLPDALQSSLATTLSPGETVDIVGAPAGPISGSTDNPEYTLVSLRDARGRMFAEFNPSRDRYVHVEGTIQALLTDQAPAVAAGSAQQAPAAPITGVQLSTGDIVRLSPVQARQHEVAVGNAFSADGPAVPAPSGALFVLAQDVNGLAMRVYLPPTGWGVRIVSDEDNGGDMSGDMGGGDDGGGGGE